MINRIIIVIVSLITMVSQLNAKKYDFVNLGTFSKCSNEINDFDNLPRKARVQKTTRSDVKYKDVSVTQPGTLESELGADINDIDSLVVRGKINAADLRTIWSSSFYGGLSVANLEYAQIEGNKLPNDAFWYQSEQLEPGADHIDCIPLRRIILPEGLEEIGERAFSYAIALVDVNFPSSLRVIKRRCFSDCTRLNVNPLIIPEGVEEIGLMAFANCTAMTGKVVLPSTIKKINAGVFFSSKITECNFPEGLEEIGDAAFYATRLKEAMLPNSCQTLTGTDHFGLCYELEKARFPEGPTQIPSGFVYNCINLAEFIMPNSVETLGRSAFWQCGALKELHLSSNLKSIDREGLYYCKKIKTILFPSSLEVLGAECCVRCKNVESIYCAAKIPPTCIVSELNPGYTPFEDIPQGIPVYVPIGSADSYRNAWGWNYFTNFIETDDFSLSGIEEVMTDKSTIDTLIFDLQGRIVHHPQHGLLYISNGKKFIYK